MKNIHIVLEETSHPGNIGAAARAMKTMGLHNLHLINPKSFPDEIAIKRASGADDVLHHAKIYPTLEQAIATSHIVFATSARNRAISLPVVTPKEAAKRILQYTKENCNISIVFGNEQSGLSNNSMLQCNYQIIIPTSEIYSSLNIAAAIQIVCYEILSTLLIESSRPIQKTQYATHAELNHLFQHVITTLIRIHFIKTDSQHVTEHKIREILNTIRLSTKQVQIIRGILNKINKYSGLDNE